MADRTYDLFAVTAKKEGSVTSTDDKGMVVTYKDGEIAGYTLGRRFGAAAGLTIPHSIISKLKVGDKIKIGDPICYNEGFFEEDFFNPKQIVLKTATNIKVVLWESAQTLEDASSISARASNKLSTKLTKVKNIVVSFDQAVNNLVKVGDVVGSDSVLCAIEDAVTANNNLFNNASIDTLRVVSAQTPKAHVKGVVERIEVYYHGDKEDMSESLRKLSNASDKELAQRAISCSSPVYTGSVDASFRIESDSLSMDTLAIRIFITSTVGTGIGDKGVFSNQLKTVFSEVLESDYTTENGEVIDAIFGAESVSARIVNSPYLIGTTNVLLELIAKKAVELYNE